MRAPVFRSFFFLRWMLVAGLSIFTISAIAAHGSGLQGAKGRSDFAALAKVPDKARVRPNPLGSNPQAREAGEKLYEQHCAECHGANAQGSGKAPDLHAHPVREASPGSLFWILSNGVVRRGMPSWSRLPPPERWQIVSYLKSMPDAEHSKHGKRGTLSAAPQ